MKKLLWGIILVLVTLTGTVYAEDKARAVIIFDASGSMWGQIDGKSKIEIARDALKDVINEWDPDVELGLTAYGHRKKGECDDIQTLIPLGKINKSRMISTVKGIQPKGKTPISRSLRKVADEIKYTEEKATIILISDGKETCDADPCATAKELEKMGIDFVTHVVGFNVDKQTEKQLKCIADVTGGEYFSAKDATALSEAMKDIVKRIDHNVEISASEEKDGKGVKAMHLIYPVIDSKVSKSHIYRCLTGKEQVCVTHLDEGKYLLISTYNKLKKETAFEVKASEVSKVNVVLGGSGTVEISASEDEEGEHVKAGHLIYPVTNGKVAKNHIYRCYTKSGTNCIKQLGTGKYLIRSKYHKLKSQTEIEIKPGETSRINIVFNPFTIKAECANAKSRVSYEVRQENGKVIGEKKLKCNKKYILVLNPGDYILKADTKKYTKEIKFTVDPKHPDSITIDLKGSDHNEEIASNIDTPISSNELQKGLDALENKEYDKALNILQPLSDNGDAQAQFALGSMYGQGFGVSRDRKKSMELVQKSADQGNLDAVNRIAMTAGFSPMLKDEEIDKIMNDTIKLYEEEIAKNNAKAMLLMGGWYESGFSVRQDIDKAIGLYKRASQNGNIEAAFKIGRSFYAGNGGTKEEGKVWLEKAAASGHKEAKGFLDDYYSVSEVKNEDIVVSSTVKDKKVTSKVPKDPIKAGWEAVKNKDHQTAYKYFSSCVVTSTQTFMGCNMGLAVTSYELSKYDETLKYTARMEKKDPNNQFVIIIKAKAMIKTNDAKGAIKILDDLIKKMENTTWEGHGDMHYYRAEAKQVLGDMAGACDDWAISLDRNKNAGENATSRLKKFCSNKPGEEIKKEYHKNGKLQKETYFQNGEIVRIKRYRQSGTLESDDSYKNSKINTHTSFAPDGTTPNQKWEYKDGNEMNYVRKQYAGGELVIEGTYVNRKRQGIEKNYASGKVRLEVSYKDGKKEEVSKWYDQNGVVTQEVIYKNDKAISGTLVGANGEVTPMSAQMLMFK